MEPVVDWEDTLEEWRPFSPKEIDSLHEMCMKLLDKYVSENPCAVLRETFESEMLDQCFDMICATLDLDDTDEWDAPARGEVMQQLEIALGDWYDFGLYVPRSGGDFGDIGPVSESVIESARKRELAGQRTRDWYARRRDMLTGSNYYKAMGSEAEQNALIYEKCCPLDPGEGDGEGWLPALDNPRGYGQIFESLSQRVYSLMFNTQLIEFGLVEHPTCPFIGASPDGVAISQGALVEFKNVTSRKLNGVPKREYWVQCQQQMEVMNIDLCYLFETQFELCDQPAEWSGWVVSEQTERGMKYTFTVDGYDPPPVQTDEEGAQRWCLTDYKCTPIMRNRRWFADTFAAVSEVWDIVQKERATGEFVARAPKSRQPRAIVAGKCMINIIKVYSNDADDGCDVDIYEPPCDNDVR